MRHGNSNRKLNRTSSHRAAMFRNMSVSLLRHEIIRTAVGKGILQVGSNLSVAGGTISLNSAGVTGALGYTPASNALTNQNIFVGNGSNVAVGVPLSGDATIANTGALTIANNAITTVKINNLAVTDAKINDVAFSKLTAKPTTVVGYGITDAVSNAGGVISMQSGTLAARPVAATAGRMYVATDSGEIYRDNGATWDKVGSAPHAAHQLPISTLAQVTNGGNQIVHD